MSRLGAMTNLGLMESKAKIMAERDYRRITRTLQNEKDHAARAAHIAMSMLTDIMEADDREIRRPGHTATHPNAPDLSSGKVNDECDDDNSGFFHMLHIDDLESPAMQDTTSLFRDGRLLQETNRRIIPKGPTDVRPMSVVKQEHGDPEETPLQSGRLGYGTWVDSHNVEIDGYSSESEPPSLRNDVKRQRRYRKQY